MSKCNKCLKQINQENKVFCIGCRGFSFLCYDCVEKCDGENSNGKKCNMIYCNDCKLTYQIMSVDMLWFCYSIDENGRKLYEHRHCNKCKIGCDNSLFKSGEQCPVIHTLKSKDFQSVTGCGCGCGDAQSNEFIWKNANDETEYQNIFVERHNKKKKQKESVDEQNKNIQKELKKNGKLSKKWQRSQKWKSYLYVE